MSKTLHSLNLFFEGLPDALRRRRLRFWGVLTVFTVGIAFGIQWLTVDMSMESFFDENDPAKILHDRFKNTFGSDDGVYIVYEAKDGDVFSQASLKALEGIQNELLQVADNSASDEAGPLSHIVDVTTLVNVSYLEVKGDTLDSRDFVGDRWPANDADREELRRQALEHKDYPRFYLSTDSRYGGIYIRTDFGVIPEEDGMESPEALFFDEVNAETAESSDEGPATRYKVTSMPEYAAFATALEGILQKPEYARALNPYPVGNPILMGFFNDVINVELEYLLLGTLLLMMLVLLLLFRTASAVLWPITIVILSNVLTLGLMGWLGIKMDMMISVLMLLILVVGIADSVHILSGYLLFRGQKLDHEQAMRRVFRKSGLACLLTSVTTAVGMLSLLLVPIPPIRNFGIAAAFGVMIAFLLTVTMLPLLMDLWKPVSRRRLQKMSEAQGKLSPTQRFLALLEPLSHRYPRRIVMAFLLVSVVAGYGLSKVQVDSNMVQIIKDGLPLRQAYVLVDQVMGGTQNMEVFLEFEKPDALKDPAVLNAMDAFQQVMETEEQAFVVKSDSLVNVVKNSFRALNEDQESAYRIPQERPALAQTLLLFESANRRDRELLVSDNYSQARISVRLLNYGSMEYLDFIDKVQGYLKTSFDPLREGYPQMTVGTTGSLPLIMQLVDLISWSQIQSFGLVLVVVTLMLFVIFGSPRTGLVAMIPNVFPVLVTFGVMGLFGFPLDGDMLIIAPIVIGIVVDDTIHFLTHFRADYLESGDRAKAISSTIREVGQAITFTSLILILGFLILVGSAHQGMANFGFLIAVAFVSALLADLLLLPSLLVLFRLRFR